MPSQASQDCRRPWGLGDGGEEKARAQGYLVTALGRESRSGRSKRNAEFESGPKAQFDLKHCLGLRSSVRGFKLASIMPARR